MRTVRSTVQITISQIQCRLLYYFRMEFKTLEWVFFSQQHTVREDVPYDCPCKILPNSLSSDNEKIQNGSFSLIANSNLYGGSTFTVLHCPYFTSLTEDTGQNPRQRVVLTKPAEGGQYAYKFRRNSVCLFMSLSKFFSQGSLYIFVELFFRLIRLDNKVDIFKDLHNKVYTYQSLCITKFIITKFEWDKVYMNHFYSNKIYT